MITHQIALPEELFAPVAKPRQTAAADKDRERERLRRELLQRILDRETRRQAIRGVPR